MVEHDTLNVGVQGSSPWGSTEKQFRNELLFLLAWIPNVSAKKVAYLTDFVYICTRKTEIEVYTKFFSQNIASLAQLVEHDTLNVGVQGSSPWGSTKGQQKR